MEKTSEREYLSVGDIAKEVGVETHTIRFWTDEFEKNITLVLGKGARRYYKRSNIPIFKLINRLIHTDGYRIKSIKDNNLIEKFLNNQVDNAGAGAVDNVKIKQILQNALDKISNLEQKLKLFL
jgi:DNA-binding transcriptional MerR regulator